MLKENQPAQSNICLDKYNRGKSTHSHFLSPGSNQTKPSGIDMQHEISLTRSWCVLYQVHYCHFQECQLDNQVEHQMKRGWLFALSVEKGWWQLRTHLSHFLDQWSRVWIKNDINLSWRLLMYYHNVCCTVTPVIYLRGVEAFEPWAHCSYPCQCCWRYLSEMSHTWNNDTFRKLPTLCFTYQVLTA